MSGSQKLQPRHPERQNAEKPAAVNRFHLSEPGPIVDHPPQAGDVCPRCAAGRVDYDGLLNLVCPSCGFTLAGCFT